MTQPQTVEQLEDRLSEPPPSVMECLSRLEGDILVLGVGGKMGPTLARMAKRASDAVGVRRRVIGVSRFSAPKLKKQLQAHGIATINCDLLNPAEVDRLPEAPNVVYMAGMKFGSTGQEAATWAMNSYLPGVISRKFHHSRIAAFSTGNVYGLTPVAHSGSLETDPLNPVGEYAMSCVGRERVFEHFSRALDLPMVLVRLNYASELRYGVLVDLAQRVFAGEAVDVRMGYFNTIWQGDANAMTLQTFAHAASPPFTINITGPEMLSVRGVSEKFGELLDREVTFTGVEARTALLSNARRSQELFGRPRVGAKELIRWIADWVLHGGRTLGKPTHFEARDGKF